MVAIRKEMMMAHTRYRFNLQLLQSLCLLYEHGVIHCDLKPEVSCLYVCMCVVVQILTRFCFKKNILLKHPAKSTIKVIDFGSSCFENDRGRMRMTSFR